MAKWNETAFGEAASAHIYPCTGHCKGACSIEMSIAWYRAGERDRKKTVPTGVETMQDVVKGRLR